MAMISHTSYEDDYILPPQQQTIDVNPNVNLDNFTLSDLLKLRAEIDQRLPARSLKDIDLEQELIVQWMSSNNLQQRVLEDADVPANQKAQVANSTAAALAQLARLQIEVNSSERLKKIEAILIECIKTLPDADQEAFFALYEQNLGSRRA